MAAGRPGLDTRPDQHPTGARRRTLHGHPGRPRAGSGHASLRASLGRHAARAREPGARFPTVHGPQRAPLRRSAWPGSGPQRRARHAERGLHHRAARVLPGGRHAGADLLHYPPRGAGYHEARHGPGGRHRPERRSGPRRRNCAELRRPRARRLGPVELRAHRPPPRVRERALCAAASYRPTGPSGSPKR